MDQSAPIYSAKIGLEKAALQILVVDDHEFNRSLMVDYLGNLSQPAVSLAATSEEAVERERFLGLPITPLQRTYVPLPAPSTARSTGFEDGRVDGGTG